MVSPKKQPPQNGTLDKRHTQIAFKSWSQCPDWSVPRCGAALSTWFPTKPAFLVGSKSCLPPPAPFPRDRCLREGEKNNPNRKAQASDLLVREPWEPGHRNKNPRFHRAGPYRRAIGQPPDETKKKGNGSKRETGDQPFTHQPCKKHAKTKQNEPCWEKKGQGHKTGNPRPAFSPLQLLAGAGRWGGFRSASRLALGLAIDASHMERAN